MALGSSWGRVTVYGRCAIMACLNPEVTWNHCLHAEVPFLCGWLSKIRVCFRVRVIRLPYYLGGGGGGGAGGHKKGPPIWRTTLGVVGTEVAEV